MRAAAFAAAAAAAASMGQVMQPTVATGQHQQRSTLEYSTVEGGVTSSSSAYPNFSEALPSTSHCDGLPYATPMDESSGPVVATPSTSEPTQ